MTQLALLHALGAACALRQELENETVRPERLDEAARLLVERSHVLLGDPECAAPFDEVRQRIAILMQQKAFEIDHQVLRGARQVLLRLIGRVWTLQEVERQRRFAGC